MSEKTVASFDGSKSDDVLWWEVEDRGAWPVLWHPPWQPSLFRPKTDWWTGVQALDFRLRPHP